MSYAAYRKAQIEDGLRFQDFVVDIAWQAGVVIAQYASKTYQRNVGESRNGIEIKYDKKRKKTGNLCIETAEKAEPRPGPYFPSGIMRNDHWIYAIGDYDIVYFFPTKFLRALCELKNGSGQFAYRRYENGTKTSEGFLLPEKDAQRYAALILTPQASEKVAKYVRDLERLANELHVAVLDDGDQMRLFSLEKEATP